MGESSEVKQSVWQITVKKQVNDQTITNLLIKTEPKKTTRGSLNRE